MKCLTVKIKKTASSLMHNQTQNIIMWINVSRNVVKALKKTFVLETDYKIKGQSNRLCLVNCYINRK